MWQRIKSAAARLNVLQLFQIAALVWVGAELHTIANRAYPEPDGIVERLDHLIEVLNRLVSVVALK